MRFISSLFAGILLAVSVAPTAQAQTFSKCRTIGGSVIVVQGPYCPAGSIWIGVG